MHSRTRRSAAANRASTADLKRLIRLPEVMAQVGLKRSSIYEKIANGTFPRPVALGANSVAWDQDLVQAWIRARLEAAGVQ